MIHFLLPLGLSPFDACWVWLLLIIGQSLKWTWPMLFFKVILRKRYSRFFLLDIILELLKRFVACANLCMGLNRLPDSGIINLLASWALQVIHSHNMIIIYLCDMILLILRFSLYMLMIFLLLEAVIKCFMLWNGFCIRNWIFEILGDWNIFSELSLLILQRVYTSISANMLWNLLRMLVSHAANLLIHPWNNIRN